MGQKEVRICLNTVRLEDTTMIFGGFLAAVVCCVAVYSFSMQFPRNVHCFDMSVLILLFQKSHFHIDLTVICFIFMA